MKAEDFVTKEISTTGKGGRKLERVGFSVDCKSVLSNMNQK